jgi:hypothetical protein
VVASVKTVIQAQVSERGLLFNDRETTDFSSNTSFELPSFSLKTIIYP